MYSMFNLFHFLVSFVMLLVFPGCMIGMTSINVKYGFPFTIGQFFYYVFFYRTLYCEVRYSFVTGKVWEELNFSVMVMGRWGNGGR